jgi:hypothetical protein
MLITVDLLAQNSLDQIFCLVKLLFTFFTKQPTLMRSLTVLIRRPQLVFPGLTSFDKLLLSSKYYLPFLRNNLP